MDSTENALKRAETTLHGIVNVIELMFEMDALEENFNYTAFFGSLEFLKDLSKETLAAVSSELLKMKNVQEKQKEKIA